MPLLLIAAVALHAEPLRLSGLFTDGVVLQRDKPIRVWGWAEPGAEVTVSLQDTTSRTHAGADGAWGLELPARAAVRAGIELSARSQGNEVRVRDVLVGEVWLCSGQSNMEWMVSQSDQGDEEVSSARFPHIRHFRVPKLAAETPQADVRGVWRPAVPEHVGAFTGVGFFFAREVHLALEGVPVGLINASWGGKMIEVFLPPTAIARTPHGPAIERRWLAETAEMNARQVDYPRLLDEWTRARTLARERGESFARARPSNPAEILAQHRPCCAFNGMIAPLVPCSIRGTLWYQGEHNISRPAEYLTLFPALIHDWRERFGQGETPFYFVQLSAYSAPMDKSRIGFAELRDAQTRTLAVPATGMAVTIDIGTPDNVHPRNKQDVGRRLARLAKAHTYGLGGEFSGPTFQSAARQGDTLQLTFAHADGGLVARQQPLPGFEVAGDDGVFRTAVAQVEGSLVKLSAAAVPEPRQIRYAWSNAPETALFNRSGLPAVPFRTVLP
ncbi:MAG: sialate O-acetylesterase [Opitutaceae bacterium]|nr:sialate O-acetylesterase [Opitutaceae bacterium]